MKAAVSVVVVALACVAGVVACGEKKPPMTPDGPEPKIEASDLGDGGTEVVVPGSEAPKK